MREDSIKIALVAFLSMVLVAGAFAAEPAQSEGRWRLPTEYPLGVTEHRLDPGNELTGWQLSDRWYLGRCRGDASTFGLFWQGEANRVSFDDRGLTLSRRL